MQTLETLPPRAVSSPVCGSCMYFVHLQEPLAGVNGFCRVSISPFYHGSGRTVTLRDSQETACPKHARALAKGAVEEWQEGF